MHTTHIEHFTDGEYVHCEPDKYKPGKFIYMGILPPLNVRVHVTTKSGRAMDNIFESELIRSHVLWKWNVNSWRFPDGSKPAPTLGDFTVDL